MHIDKSKPLYSLSVGEFINLQEETFRGFQLKQNPEQEKKADEEETFTIPELATFLRCSLPTIHKYKKLGLPYYRIGRKVLFKKTEVLKFMSENSKGWRRR